MKSKAFSRNKQIKRICIIFIYAVLITILIYSGFKIFNWYRENKQTSKVMDQIKEIVTIEDNNEQTKYKIDFESLLKRNKDVVGWLKVNGTNIDYPVVRGENNDYYLTHSFDNKYNSSGWLFIDYRNKIDGTDRNIVIFGHNRKDGSMFGSLKNILTEEWKNNNENHVIKFYTPEGYKEYKVFSIYKIENEEYYIKIKFKDNEYSNFIKTIKNRSIKNFEEDISEEDNILTLSTCADNVKNRVVLHAKEIR